MRKYEATARARPEFGNSQQPLLRLFNIARLSTEKKGPVSPNAMKTRQKTGHLTPLAYLLHLILASLHSMKEFHATAFRLRSRRWTCHAWNPKWTDYLFERGLTHEKREQNRAL